MADEPVTTPLASGGASPEALSESGGTTETTTPATPTVSPELQELRKQVQTAREESESAKRYVVQLVTQLQQAQQPAVSEDDRKAAIRERLEQDPEDAIERVFVERMGPLMREQADKQSELARDVARREMAESGWAEEWAEHEAAVDAFMAQQPADVRTAKKAWKDALKIVLLNGDFDQVVMKRASKKLSAEKQAATESASPGRGSRVVTDHLTDTEKRVASEFGMSDAEYLKHKRELASAQAE